jgi:hypothetical protein
LAWVLRPPLSRVRRKSATLFPSCLPEPLQPGRHIGVEALQEVPVPVERHGDRRVSEPGLNRLGMSAGGDRQGDGGMAEIMIVPTSA